MTFEITRIYDKSTPWLEVLIKYGFQNKPFILGEWSTSNWSARNDWVLPDGTPNKVFLKQNYGSSIVPILVNGSEYKSTTLTEYLDNMNDPEVYLKDWHFQNHYGASMYILHPFFSRDFVNCEKWTTNKDENPFGDDYRFVYIGRAGSWTKFHADVVSSHSWSANICGRKKWFMMPPGSEELFRCSSSESGYVEDIREFPELFEQAKVITFIQEPGEIVFVPSNWHHQVHNLVDTISINHNWMNCTNLSVVYDFLKRRKQDVIHELRDCFGSFLKEEFEEKVEDILFADARLNMRKFRQLCQLIKNSRNGKKFEYYCNIHGSEIWKCMSSPSCYSYITSICSCSTSFCSKCSNFIEQLEFSLMLTNDQLSLLYDYATTSKRLPNDFVNDEKDLDKVIRYGELFKACHSINSTDYVQKAEDLNDEEKRELITVVTKKLATVSKKEDDIQWNVDIVIGNSHVAKSLRPVINIRMPTAEGETFEFDIDSFAQFRKRLAEAVLAVNPQE